MVFYLKFTNFYLNKKFESSFRSSDVYVGSQSPFEKLTFISGSMILVFAFKQTYLLLNLEVIPFVYTVFHSVSV